MSRRSGVAPLGFKRPDVERSTIRRPPIWRFDDGRSIQSA